MKYPYKVSEDLTILLADTVPVLGYDEWLEENRVRCIQILNFLDEVRMCKLCDIEHSPRWTCAQAKANLEDWAPKPVQTFESPVKPEVKGWVPPQYVPRKWGKNEKGN